MKRKAAIFALIILMAGLGTVVQSASDDAVVLAGPQAEVPAWQIGDWWDYELGGGVDAMGMTMSATGNIRFEVTEIMTQNVGGIVYQLYNVSISGSFTGSGSGTVQGVDFTATITSGTLGGYWWIERGDLAVVVDNETVAASGDVTTIMGTFPLTLNAEMTNTYDPSREDFDFPMEVGDQWDISIGMTTTGYLYYFVDIPLFPIEDTVPLDNFSTLIGTSVCNQQSMINVPAGSFDSFDASMGVSDQKWYSEPVGFMVKWENHGGFGMFGDIWVNLTDYDRVTPMMAVEEYLSPERVNPGGNVTVYGTSNASQFATVNVKTPVTGDVWMGFTNATGGYSINITAPNIPDNTPTLTDFASHGVIVEINDGGTIGYAARTVILILPDVYPLNLTLSPPPTMGNPTDIFVEVHTGPEVGVTTEIQVSFDVDGIPFATETIPMVNADSFVVTSRVWLATIGLHDITVVLDPLDSILEYNEANNSITVQVAVMGPDLAPTNISIENSVSYFFQTGEPLGHVSPIMNVPTGDFVNITLNVTNFGLSFTSEFTLSIVQMGVPGKPLLDEHLTPLTQGGSHGPFNAVWNVPLVEGMYYFNISADPYLNVTEMNDDNNSFFLQFNAVNIYPDLYITPSDISLASQPYLGNPTAIYADVHANANRSVTSSFDVSFFSDGQLIADDTINSIGAGGVANASVVWIPDVGTHTIRVEIDSQDFIGESDETNNSAEIVTVVPMPDLAPHDILVNDGAVYSYPDPELVSYTSDVITTYIGQSTTLSLNLSNFQAPFFNTDFRVEFYETSGLGGPPSKPAFYDSGLLSSLGTGESHGPLSSAWIAPSPAGNYFVNMTVDIDQDVPESSEGNNTFILLFQVLEPDEVDYTPVTTMNSRVKMTVGDDVNITSRVENLGITAASADTTIAFYEQSDPSTLLHQDTVIPLNGGETSASVFGFDWIPPGTGTYVIVIEVDYYDDIPETNETNNLVSVTIEVYDPPVTNILVDIPKYVTDVTFVTSSTIFQLVATDFSGEGLDGVNYRIGIGPWLDYLQTGEFTIPEEGLTTIEYYSEDNIGGEEQHRSISVHVDDTPPETSLWYTDEEIRPSTDLRLNSSDEASGVASTRYRVDGGSWISYAIPFSMEAGTHTLEYFSIDNLGNEETPSSLEVTVGSTLEDETETNYKPLLSVVLAVLLLIAGLLLCRREFKSEEESRESGFFASFDNRSFILFSVSFALVEIIIGVFSAFTGSLSIPPTFGAGLIVDLVVFVVGLIIAYFWNGKEKTKLTSVD